MNIWQRLSWLQFSRGNFSISAYDMLWVVEGTKIELAIVSSSLRKVLILKFRLMLCYFLPCHLFLDIVVGFNIRNTSTKSWSTLISFTIDNTALHWNSGKVSGSGNRFTIFIFLRFFLGWWVFNILESASNLLFAMCNLLGWAKINLMLSKNSVTIFNLSSHSSRASGPVRIVSSDISSLGFVDGGICLSSILLKVTTI